MTLKEALFIIKRLTEENAAKDLIIAKLEERIVTLERQLKLDSHTSSKPPTSDGLNKKPRKPQSLRPKGAKKSGGQKGHLGKTLKQVTVPDKTIYHEPENCSNCQRDLRDTSIASICKRQVFDIPPLEIQVTEHQRVTKCCPVCKRVNRGKVPTDVLSPVQYGQNLQSLAIYLQHQQLLPENRLHDFFVQVFNLPINTATISKIGARFAHKITPQLREIEENLRGSPVKHVDETGFRIKGKTCWLHVLCNEFATYYRPTEKRGDIIENLEGFVVHDHFKPYGSRMPNAKHVFCNAHHLRELKALIEYDKERWAKKMYKLLQLASHIKNKYRGIVSQGTRQIIFRLFDTYIEEGLAYHQNLPALAKDTKRKRTGHNLLLRLQKHKKSVLAFLTAKKIPFTNNQAERDIRMMKVKQKISGCFRTMCGANIFCKIRSFISTIYKQNLNVLAEIAAVIGGKRSLNFLTL